MNKKELDDFKTKVLFLKKIKRYLKV